VLLLATLALPPCAGAQTAASPPHSRAEILAGARDVMHKARYSTLVTIGADGHPQARIVDPIVPDADFAIWIATNPLTRKAKEIERDPRVTLLYFDTGTSSYVTVLARATVVTDAVEKAKHWKDEWSSIYEMHDGKRDFTLIRVTPLHLEIVSASRGLVGDPKTWLPLSIDFP
jgi:general stress protein 26